MNDFINETALRDDFVRPDFVLSEEYYVPFEFYYTEDGKIVIYETLPYQYKADLHTVTLEDGTEIVLNTEGLKRFFPKAKIGKVYVGGETKYVEPE
jgi:hypothetical protein